MPQFSPPHKSQQSPDEQARSLQCDGRSADDPAETLVEGIDRQTTIAESRRDASVRVIDRGRAVIGETLRYCV